MQLDAAQILRQTIASTTFDAAASGAQKAEPAVESGVAMGFGVQVQADPAAELMDSMEELSFQFEENEMKSVGERKLGETRGKENPYIKALESWVKVLPDLPGEQFTRALLSMLRQAQSRGELPSPREFLQQLGEGSSDPSHQFAMSDILEQALSESETEFRALLESSRKMLLAEKGEEIRAGINLASEVNARATTPEEMQDLRDMYRGEILGFSTPQQCFRSIMGSRGAAGLQAAIDFLTAGCGADIQSASPSKSPEELRRIMLDLQCVQVLKTVFDRMGALGNRMLTQFNQQCLMNGEQMTGKVMDFTERPFVGAGDIKDFIAGCGIEKLLARMDFCRELTGVFRQLSSRLFSNEQDRIRLIDAAQEHLDGIVEEEYEQEDDEDDKEGDSR